MRARDKDGNLSESSKNTTFKTIGTPPAPPPSAPQVRIKDETATSLSLEWGVLDGGSGVRILINDEFWKDVLILPGAIIMELLPNHEYTISVSKFDIYGQLSEPTILTHVLKDTTAPSVPGNLKMSDKTPDSVTLSWVASRDDVEVSGYVIDNNEVYFDSTQQTQYHATGLMPGINSFEVRALDNSGNTSEPASILVEAGPPPGAPSNFRFTRGLIAKLEWDAPVEPVNRYDITLTGPQGNKLDYDSTTPILQPVLFPLTRYEVSIIASNAAGKSLPLLAEITT
ncbi:Exoglucanase B precursor [compost metagenome]